MAAPSWSVLALLPVLCYDELPFFQHAPLLSEFHHASRRLTVDTAWVQ